MKKKEKHSEKVRTQGGKRKKWRKKREKMVKREEG